MKRISRLSIPLIISLVLFCCKKTDAPTPPVVPPVDTPTAYKTKEVTIVLPQGVKLDLATSTVQSLSVSTKVSAEGKSKAAFNQGYPNIAYVFDKDKRIVLAGFITDSSATISAASTAKVLLYFGYATMMEQYELTKIFINQIDGIKGTNEWYTTFENLFKADPLVLDKGSFVAPLRSAIRKISAGRKMNGLPLSQTGGRSNAKLIADITVMDNTEKSGLRIHSPSLSKISFDNNYRRRAHAFLYKVKSTMDGGTVKETPVASNSFAEVDTTIDPVGGFTSFTGVLGAWIEDKEIEFATLTAGPVTLKLNDDETEAEYKLRIVGPGRPGTNKTISEQETLKLTQLEIETLALDFLLPVMLEVVGNKDDLALIDGSRHVTGQIEDFLEKTTAILKITPGAYEEVRKGNYDMALRKIMEGMYSELLAAKYEELVKLTAGILEIIAQQKYYISPHADIFKDAEKKVKILKLIDLGLFANDLARMGAHIVKSSQLEEWVVKARTPKVTLNPEKSEVVPLMQQKITCVIKNFNPAGGDTHAFYEWSTSGKLGKISDTKGHTNLTSFASADQEVYYNCTARASDLKDGDNFEYIYVKVKFGSDIIGYDTAVINVKKNRYQMLPAGVTLTGKKYSGSRNDVLMSLKRIDKAAGIGADPNIDYKIVWTIGGKYGKISGPGVNGATTITLYNNESATYECTDDQTKEGTENIQASIYMKQKSETEYILYDQVVGSVKINNDDKKKILHIPFSFLHGDKKSGPFTSYPSGNTYYSYVCWKGQTVSIPEDTTAKSYSVKFYNIESPVIGAPSGISWTAGKLPGYAPPTWLKANYENGVYTVVYSWGSRNGGSEGHANGTPRAGMAEVTITLK
jgi:hypothetical protein